MRRLRRPHRLRCFGAYVSLQRASLSNDGAWVAYTRSPQVGDGKFVVRSTTGTTEYRVPVGYIGRPNNTPGGARPPAAGGVPHPSSIVRRPHRAMRFWGHATGCNAGEAVTGAGDAYRAGSRRGRAVACGLRPPPVGDVAAVQLSSSLHNQQCARRSGENNFPPASPTIGQCVGSDN